MWRARESSRPADIQGINFLVAGVSRKDRRAIRRDVDLSFASIHRTMKVFQARDSTFYRLSDTAGCALGL